MSAETKQFLVVVDPSADSVEVEELGTDPQAAMRAYKKREHELAPDDRIEVVLLGAASAWQTVTFRDGLDGEPVTSRFAFVRVRAAHRWQKATPSPPREEWLIAEWPQGTEAPTNYWLSNLPPDTPPDRLARLARLRWKIELDYRQLKGELGLDHYEGRSWLGWQHHTALVTAAHGFLTLERQDPKARRPA